MRQIALSEYLFELAEGKAIRAGFASVEEWVEDVIRGDLRDDDIDLLFTPERLALIDEAVEQAKRGNTLSEADLQKRLSADRERYMGRRT